MFSLSSQKALKISRQHLFLSNYGYFTEKRRTWVSLKNTLYGISSKNLDNGVLVYALSFVPLRTWEELSLQRCKQGRKLIFIICGVYFQEGVSEQWTIENHVSAA